MSRIPMSHVGALLLLGFGVATGPLEAVEPPPEQPAQTTQTASSSSQSASPDAETPDTESPDTESQDAAKSVPAPNGQDAETLQVYDEVDVRERADDLVGIAVSSSEGTTGRLDLERRPILRPGELLETAPGVIATQHSGGGKANQFFVRGFNLDHGTDFSVRVGGVPVNMPTHGHGQGYADLSFLIPEMVDRVRYRKGPYFADVGDFSAAGSADMALVRSLPESLLRVTGGSYDERSNGYGRLLWADSVALSDDDGEGDGSRDLVGAVELFHEDGPWRRGQSYDGVKAMARLSTGDARRGSSLTFLGYSADWLSTDQVPRRAVESGLIDRFDLIDPGPRGETDRFSLAARWHDGDDSSFTEGGAYVLFYDFGLISNFTYFLDDAETGDQFEQADRRWVAGGDVHRSWLGDWSGRRVETRVGLDARYDEIDNGLFRTSELVRTATVREDSITQLGAGLWADASIQWHDKVRTRFGLRGDVLSTDVDSDRVVNSGSDTDTIVSPKLSMIFGPWRSTEIYVNLGYGHHSNDTRGAVITVDPVSEEFVDTVDPLVRARGADVGFRTMVLPGLHTTLTAFVLELDSELVFVGDAGATEAGRPSRRTGVEWTNFYRLNERLSFDLDVTLTDATFTDEAPEGDDIPGAIGTTIAAGMSFEKLPVSANTSLFGALRWRYFGDVPLIEDGSVEWSSSSLVNARLGVHLPNGLDLALDIFNLLDSSDSDIEYFYASRLPGEPVDGIEDVHFHPIESRSARLSLTWRR
ncbi:MAG: TonB-dependent receptor [Acidobacteriota bacterium]